MIGIVGITGWILYTLNIVLLFGCGIYFIGIWYMDRIGQEKWGSAVIRVRLHFAIVLRWIASLVQIHVAMNNVIPVDINCLYELAIKTFTPEITIVLFIILFKYFLRYKFCIQNQIGSSESGDSDRPPKKEPNPVFKFLWPPLEERIKDKYLIKCFCILQGIRSLFPITGFVVTAASGMPLEKACSHPITTAGDILTGLSIAVFTIAFIILLLSAHDALFIKREFVIQAFLCFPLGLTATIIQFVMVDWSGVLLLITWIGMNMATFGIPTIINIQHTNRQNSESSTDSDTRSRTSRVIWTAGDDSDTKHTSINVESTSNNELQVVQQQPINGVMFAKYPATRRVLENALHEKYLNHFITDLHDPDLKCRFMLWDKLMKFRSLPDSMHGGHAILLYKKYLARDDTAYIYVPINSDTYEKIDKIIQQVMGIDILDKKEDLITHTFFDDLIMELEAELQEDLFAPFIKHPIYQKFITETIQGNGFVEDGRRKK
jgi:hypothetical protein